ncbi:MAG: PEGA domain-containing protein [Candidatus Omnitrophica bacterium]|nr:PEGA domain-containing protein [Candidatus Omnitrophota bacterium]
MPTIYRLMLFYFCVLLFFILLPVCMLYSLGYRVNWKTHRLEQLGMMVVRTTPDDARIILNGKILYPKTPARIPNLFPGEYAVQLAKEGYQTWTGAVRVKPNWAARLDSVFLFPGEMEFQALSDIQAEQFFVSPKGRKMLVCGRLAEDRGLWLLDLFPEEEILVLEHSVMKSHGLRCSEALKITWAKNEKAVLLEEGGHIFLLDLKKPNRLLDVKGAIGFYPESAVWSAKAPDTFYYLHQGSLSAYSFKRKRNQSGLVEGIQAFKYYDGFLYYIEQNAGILWRWSEDLLEKNSIIRVPDYSLKNHYEIIVNPLGDILPPLLQADVRVNQTEFYDLNAAKKFEGIKTAGWDRSGKRLLLEREGELLILEETASRGAKLKGTETIETPRSLRRVFWFDDEKLLFVYPQAVFLRQLGGESQPYAQEIFRFPAGWKEIFWDVRFKQLYFISQPSHSGEGTLRRVDLSHGPVRAFIRNMRETMSDGWQFFQESGQTK